MKRLIILLLFCLFGLVLHSEADNGNVNPAPAEVNLGKIVIQKSQSPTPTDSTGIHYGFTNLTFHNGTAPEAKIDHPPAPLVENSFSLVKNAEANLGPLGPTPAIFAKICNSVNQARQIHDLKTVLTETNYQQLRSKIDNGASPHAVLAMIQAQRPDKIRVMDSKIEQDQVTLAVTGESPFGPMQGMIYLLKNQGQWRIAREDWHAGKSKTIEMSPAVLLLSEDIQAHQRNRAGLIASITPEYKFDRNFLPLSKVPYKVTRRAFEFVFLLNKPQKTDSSKKADRSDLHILWTASKKRKIEQKLIKDEYPIDVSIANDQDGYAPGQWNLVLPSRKPRQVKVTFLLSF